MDRRIGGGTRLTRALSPSSAPLAVGGLTVVGAAQAHRGLLVAVALGVGVLLVASLAASRDLAGLPLLAALALAAAGVTTACYGDPRNLGWFAMCAIAGWVAWTSPPRTAAVAGTALAATFVLQLLTVSREPGWVTWVAGTALSTGAFIFTRRQRELVLRLRDAQTELDQRARTEERHRIAGEMHDLVGHTLTVTLLHLDSARLALDDDLPRARGSLTEAERAARTSLDDVRAAVSLMRTAPSPTTRPAPSATDIADLVRSYRRAGAEVVLEVRGPLTRLDGSRGLAAYRVVQESLTNAVRHGDGAPVQVRIDAGAARTTITVRSGGTPSGAATGGIGLAAMRERIETVGGRLSAGPVPSGWQVEAVLPT
ncbi:sensor histidine kinase [Mumia sp. DW29H23]|uniref:sensor histidine kinase n=1 Tax=Mumia sp. DW29H23 TaxID=3421241 RepID=UPI003D69FA3F